MYSSVTVTREGETNLPRKKTTYKKGYPEHSACIQKILIHGKRTETYCLIHFDATINKLRGQSFNITDDRLKGLRGKIPQRQN